MFIRIALCILMLAALLYSMVRMQNQVTHYRLQIPQITKKLDDLKQENIRLQFEIDQFESPVHLIPLARSPAYGHLKYPLKNEVEVLIKEPSAPLASDAK